MNMAENGSRPRVHRGEIETRDGLYLSFRGFTGELLSLMSAGECVPLKVTSPDYPVLSVADHGDPARSGRIRIKAESVSENVNVMSGSSDEAHINLTCKVEGAEDYVKFSLQVKDTSGEDRAVTVRFQIPVKAEGWSWWDDVATSREIRGGTRYVRYGREDKGTFPLFWYPVGAISNEAGKGLALAVPMDPPTLARMGYDGDFFIELDLGLSQAATRFPRKADLTFYFYRFDGKWGLRAALKKYYDLFPRYFLKRITREGMWLARTPTQKIERPEDFGITFHQASSVMTSSLHLDNAIGLYTFLYDEPARVGMVIPFEEDSAEPAAADRPSDEYIVGKLRDYAEDQSSSEHASACRVIALASRKPDGSYYVWAERQPETGWRCLFSSGPDPEIAVPQSEETVLDGWKREQLSRMRSLYGGKYDGQYIDSAEWLSDTVNCFKEHFPYADYPLGFHEAGAIPGIITGLTRFKYLKAVREELLKAGKLMMANFTPIRFGFFATLLDLAGTEVWHREPGRVPGFGGDPAQEAATSVSEYDWRNEQAMYYRRAMMCQKPYCILLQVPTASQLREFGTERVMVYLNWCTFFAMYPGIGHGLDQDPDPYREYYRKYMPVIRSLGTAGWEPVTHAATDNPALRVERYGYWSQGTLGFAVRNFSDEEAAGHLSIDSAALHIGDRTFARDAFSSAELRWKKATGQMVIPIRLQPAHTAVIRLGPR